MGQKIHALSPRETEVFVFREDVMKKVNVEALFLGPKSENQRFFKEMINFMIDEHIHWRRDFHPDDKQAVTLSEHHRHPFVKILAHVPKKGIE